MPNAATYTLPNEETQTAFLKELQALRQEINASLGEADIQQLRRFERRGRIAGILGTLTAWIAPNPISAYLLSFAHTTRFIMMHHISHGGYDRVPGIPQKYTRKHFAQGWNRYLDWLDWMAPKAWDFEHNVLHHGFTGQKKDPDVVERNTESMRKRSASRFGRLFQVMLLSLNWRRSYYSRQTLFTLLRHQYRKKDPTAMVPKGVIRRELWKQSFLPYGVVRFVLFPALFLPLGAWAAFSALCNSVLADFISNVHTFAVIATNHTADDLYRFDEPPKNKAEHYIHQIIGSTNFPCGHEWQDHGYLYLNYQIEHHVWPDLPMLKYQQYQPRLKALCEKYDIPYVQGTLRSRVKKLIQVMIGDTQMKRLKPRISIEVEPHERASTTSEVSPTKPSAVPA